MNENEYRSLLGKTFQGQYFDILRDKNWHCRDCAQQVIRSNQLAGGGGVQGLERGNNSRPGIVIETMIRRCSLCDKPTYWDRWTGEFQQSNSAASIPEKLRKKVLGYYGYVDTIEQRKRQAHELVIDHRFPMERWGESEERNDINMSEEDIQRKFQLLKKDSSGNHNLLKSRACEKCIKTKKRGYPMGIKYYYEGDENWPADCPTTGKEAEQGCIGCGWYDFEAWRKGLNSEIES